MDVGSIKNAASDAAEAAAAHVEDLAPPPPPPEPPPEQPAGKPEAPAQPPRPASTGFSLSALMDRFEAKIEAALPTPKDPGGTSIANAAQAGARQVAQTATGQASQVSQTAQGSGPAAPRRLPEGGVVIDVPQQAQGNFNSCGTTSTSMIMNYFGRGHSVETIDAAIRPNDRGGTGIDSFTAPADIRNYLQDNGFRANMTGDASTADLRRMIDQGVPPMILTDWETSGPPTGDSLHYVVVSGYRPSADGRTEYEITNPWGHKEWVSEDLLNERWSNLQINTNTPIGSVSTGFNRVMITAVPSSGTIPNADGGTTDPSTIQLPPNNAPALPNALAQLASRGIGAYNDVRAGLEDLKRRAGDVVDDVREQVEETVEDVRETVEETVEDVRETVEDTVDTVTDAADEARRRIEDEIRRRVPW